MTGYKTAWFCRLGGWYRLIWLFTLFPLFGCDSIYGRIFGEANVVVYNHTESSLWVGLHGRTTTSFELPPVKSRALHGVPAGTYEIVFQQNEQMFPYTLPMPKDTTVLVNRGEPTCFVRADLASILDTMNHSVRILQRYEVRESVTIREPITLLPEESVDNRILKGKTSPYSLHVVPCDYLETDHEMTLLLKKQLAQ